MKIVLLVVGLVALIFVEILRVYFIMPFPGSQEEETIQWAYLIHTNIGWLRLAGLALVAYPIYSYMKSASPWVKITLSVAVGFYAVVFYMFNYRFLADKMFLQPENVDFLDAQRSTVSPKQLVLGVTIKNESKAYPIEIIGYHHQIRDVVGGEVIMVTYCTVCRTGRVYSPVLDGKPESFRLVGMDHYNAMFEDAETGSWWRQVSGEAIVGPRKGAVLRELESQQMSLGSWINLHPATTILQPDMKFRSAYQELEDYDEGKRKGRLERRDSLAWMDKSWVVGIQLGMDARAYDWIQLQDKHVINDALNGVPLVIFTGVDSISHYSFDRTVDGNVLTFTWSAVKNAIEDDHQSTWSAEGKCLQGVYQGKNLKPIQSYQEYWHSWRTFHPQTTRHEP